MPPRGWGFRVNDILAAIDTPAEIATHIHRRPPSVTTPLPAIKLPHPMNINHGETGAKPGRG